MHLAIKVTNWVSRLPEVGTPILGDCDAVMRQWRELEQAKRQVEAKESALSDAVAKLETRVAKQWSAQEIQAAKNRAMALG